jgi:hypothetical protein
MNLPAFTASASLYRTSNRYRSLRQGGEVQRTAVNPQLGGPGFEGLANCLNDCADEHPDWTAARCRAICRDPGGTSPGGYRAGYGPSCEDNPPNSCYAFYANCALGPWACYIAGSFVEGCLEDSRQECRIARHGPLRGGSSYPRSGVIGIDMTEELPFLATSGSSYYDREVRGVR